MSEKTICLNEKCDKPSGTNSGWCHEHKIVMLSAWMRLKAMREVL